MSSDTKFICKFEDHPTMKEALDKLTAFQAQAKEKRKFIEQQTKALAKERAQHWRALWDEGQKLGLIDPSYQYDDWGMELGDDRKQLFIESSECPVHGKKCPDHGGIAGIEISGQGLGGLADVLRSLLSRDDD